MYLDCGKDTIFHHLTSRKNMLEIGIPKILATSELLINKETNQRNMFKYSYRNQRMESYINSNLIVDSITPVNDLSREKNVPVRRGFARYWRPKIGEENTSTGFSNRYGARTGPVRFRKPRSNKRPLQETSNLIQPEADPVANTLNVDTYETDGHYEIYSEELYLSENINVFRKRFETNSKALEASLD